MACAGSIAFRKMCSHLIDVHGSFGFEGFNFAGCPPEVVLVDRLSEMLVTRAISLVSEKFTTSCSLVLVRHGECSVGVLVDWSSMIER